jgi:hypothetical protein
MMSGMVLVDMMMIWGFVMLEMLFGWSWWLAFWVCVNTRATDWVFSLVKV